VAEVARALAPATVRLVRVGGPFTAGQTTLARDLGIQARISQLPVLDDRTLAAVYRRAAAVLLPSDREGFGLPVIEALACGAPVIASDLPVLREVGGSTVEYCRPGDARAWASTTIALLGEQSAHQEQALARRESGIAWARRFTWTRFASQLADIYLELAGVRHAVPASPEACRA
jgi:glycosyltransferase involved in cell wall biosynthesis